MHGKFGAEVLSWDIKKLRSNICSEIKYFPSSRKVALGVLFKTSALLLGAWGEYLHFCDSML